MLDKLMKTGAEEIEKAAIAREIATNSGLSDKGVHMDYFDRGWGDWGGGCYTFYVLHFKAFSLNVFPLLVVSSNT